MIEHQDMRIFGDVATAVAALLAAEDGNWVRRADRDEDPLRWFANAHLSALVSIGPEGGDYRVLNVLPVDKNRVFSVGECNRVVQSFCAWATSIVEGAGGWISMSHPNQSPKDWMAPELARDLELAVQNGYPSHPQDSERFNRFLVQAHQAGGVRMVPGDLYQWLVQDKKWDTERAGRLRDRFANGLELLKAYDQLVRM